MRCRSPRKSIEILRTRNAWGDDDIIFIFAHQYGYRVCLHTQQYGHWVFNENSKRTIHLSHVDNHFQPLIKKNTNTPKKSTKICISTCNMSHIKVEIFGVEFKFLIDTGAGTSLIKSPKLQKINSICDPSDTMSFTGLCANASVHSIGTVELNLKVYDETFPAKFHVIQQESNIPFDGIIGNDFLEIQQANIDFEKRELRIKSLPFPIVLNLNLNPNQSGSYFLNPRSETLIEVDILNDGVTEGITPEISICKGVYLARSLVKVDGNNKAITTILNTNNCKVKIEHIKLYLEPFQENHSQVFSYCQNQSTKISPERLKLLKENIRTDHLNPEEKSSVLETCMEFNDLFYLPNDELTSTKTLTHEIKLSNAIPIQSRNYRYPEVHKKEVTKQIEKMLKQKIIRPSVSPYSSPLWVVPKKLDASGEKKWRVVIDYRGLNNVTIGDAYPIPLPEEIFDEIGYSKYFTTLDLANGFHQIEVKPEDIPKTAFSTPLGHYEFLRMPFGLRNAPSTFQRLMNTVLSGLQGMQCLVYVDDIVIFASSLEEHKNKLKAVFNRLRENNLLLQPDKCEFLRKEIVYLGHKISENGVAPNNEKIKAVMDYPIPKSPKQIKQFLGLIGYYRRFVKDFAKIAKPLTLLLKKDAQFQWLSHQQEAFEQFKRILTSEPILQFPDFNKPFVLTTDASNYAIGAVLSQGEIGKDLPIAYASRTLSKSEVNYSTTEKELLAIVWGTKHFRPYLFGKKFFIITDHKPLTWLFNCKDPSSKLVRWRLKLEEYEYEIKYKPGRINSNVDALSRNPVLAIQENNETYDTFVKYHYENDTIPDIPLIKDDLFSKFPNALIFSKDLDENNSNFENLASVHDVTSISDDISLYDTIPLRNPKNQQTFLLISKLNHFDNLSYKDLFHSLQKLRDHLIEENIDELYLKNPIEENPYLKQDMFNELIQYLFSKHKLKISLVNKPKFKPQTKQEIKTILEENHSSAISGHAGYLRTYKRVKENYKWPNMKRDIKTYIKSCQSCQINKGSKSKIAPMQITTTSERPFQRLALDIVGPLPVTENENKYIITMQDDLTKYSFAKSIKNHEAKTVANQLLEFITIFGIPEAILSDQGSDFCSETIKELNRLLKIKHVFSSPYHPQTNGALERSHLTLKEYLKHYINQNQNNWDDYVSLAMFTYNNHIHSSTGFTPFELIFGRKSHIPSSLSSAPEFRYSYDDYHSNLKLKFNKAYEMARQHLIKNKERSKIYYDKKNNVTESKFKIGDFVYIKNQQIKPGLTKKLSEKFKGPYEITKLNPNNTVKLKLKNNKFVTYHPNLLKIFIPDKDELPE